jgi:prepilin-type N-terminal cleavage/methylation domain-containing protein
LYFDVSKGVGPMVNPSHRRGGRPGFTLIELLVVIAIIGDCSKEIGYLVS